MENRERDNVSQNRKPTDAGNVNRSTSERKGRIESDSNADFGQNIGRSENWDSEPSRRGGSLGSSNSESSRDSSIDDDSDLSGSRH